LPLAHTPVIDVTDRQRHGSCLGLPTAKERGHWLKSQTNDSAKAAQQPAEDLHVNLPGDSWGRFFEEDAALVSASAHAIAAIRLSAQSAL
jgi:hypothetical protein